MGGIKVKTISRETVKPSSPTPPHLRDYKLCLLDQAAPPAYFPICLFYKSPPNLHTTTQQHMILDRLKASLSQTLTHYYPLAGRYNKDDDFSIQCNDSGVSFVQAQVDIDIDISQLVFHHLQPDMEFLQQLLPCHPYTRITDAEGQLVPLGIQVTFFDNHISTTMAIGICIWHGVADASTLSHFLHTWAAVSRGDLNSDDAAAVVIRDHRHITLFPPHGFFRSPQSKWDAETAAIVNNKPIVKRFVFQGSKIADLRARFDHHPTRIEAISALIWAAAIGAKLRTKQGSGSGFRSATHLIDMRKRVNPALPEQSMGCFTRPGQTAEWDDCCSASAMGTERIMKDGLLAGKLRQSIAAMRNEENSRAQYENGGEGFVEFWKWLMEELGKGDVLMFSSWCRFPFYEADFGFGLGKPEWVGFCNDMFSCVAFLDAKDGEGIEAYVGFEEEDMAEFQKDPFLLQFASFPNPLV